MKTDTRHDTSRRHIAHIDECAILHIIVARKQKMNHLFLRRKIENKTINEFIAKQKKKNLNEMKEEEEEKELTLGTSHVSANSAKSHNSGKFNFLLWSSIWHGFNYTSPKPKRNICEFMIHEFEVSLNCCCIVRHNS